ncbi:MAG: hypothetical protein ACKVPX_00595 [Myxococcaceae bacterium]
MSAIGDGIHNMTMGFLNLMKIDVRNSQVGAGLMAEIVKNLLTLASLSGHFSPRAQDACAIGGLIAAGFVQAYYSKWFKNKLHLSEVPLNANQLSVLGRVAVKLGWSPAEVQSVFTGAFSSTATQVGLATRNEHIVRLLGQGDMKIGHERADRVSSFGSIALAMIGVFFETHFGDNMLVKTLKGAKDAVVGAAAGMTPGMAGAPAAAGAH